MQWLFNYPVMELGLCSSLKLSSIELRWESPLPSTEEVLQNMSPKGNDTRCNATAYIVFVKNGKENPSLSQGRKKYSIMWCSWATETPWQTCNSNSHSALYQEICTCMCTTTDTTTVNMPQLLAWKRSDYTVTGRSHSQKEHKGVNKANKGKYVKVVQW